MTKKLFLLGDAAKLANVKPYQLTYAISSKSLPEPELRLGNLRIFTESDVQDAIRHFSRKPRKKEDHEK